ncbi:NAD(P)-binding protein [Sarocladium strictum]
MTAQVPKTTGSWRVHLKVDPAQPDTDSLRWHSKVPLRQLGPTDVCVKLHAASLNFRDLAIIRGAYPLPMNDGVVPGCDGVGEVIAVGENVRRFSIGDKVMPYLFSANWMGGNAPPEIARHTALGGTVDGTFTEHGVYDQEGLVAMPSNLTWAEGASLQGTFATAWNALMGGAQKLRVGDSVLVQGSGTVSLSTLQLAAAAGAIVIATTSSKAKAEKLKALGATHIINYNEEPEWGAAAKRLSPGGRGVKFVTEVVGSPYSYRQSLEALAAGGEMIVVGFMGEPGASEKAQPSFLEAMIKPCTIRGVQLSSRLQLEELCRAIEGRGIKPFYDEKTFELKDLKRAYQYLADQKNFGKVVVTIT